MLVAVSAAAGDVPRSLDDYVLLGIHDVDIGNGTYVAAGHIGVNAPGGTLVFDGEAFLADTSSIVSDVVVVGEQSSVADVFTNHSVLAPDAIVRGVGPLGFTAPIVALPPLPAFAPGVTPVVAAADDVTTLGPGAYGAVTVGKKGTLVLTGGTYELASVDVLTLAGLVVTGPATINIQGDLKTGTFCRFGAARSGVGPRDVRVNVGGAARLGNASHVAADFYAPNARLLLGRSLRGEGRFVADSIQGDETVNLRLTGPPGTTAVGSVLCSLTQDNYGTPNGASNPLGRLVTQHPELFPVTIGSAGINSLTVQDALRLACLLPTTGPPASLCLRLGCIGDTIVDRCGNPPILDFVPTGDGASGGQGAGTLAGEVLTAKLNVQLSNRGIMAPGLGDFVLPSRLCTTKCPRGREVNPNPMKVQTGSVGVADGLMTVDGLIARADQALGAPHCRPGTCTATSTTAVFPGDPIRISDLKNALEVVNQCFRGCATVIPCD